MPEYHLSDTDGIQVKFGDGGDLLFVAFKKHASGEMVRAGTFFYGSGKTGFGKPTTKLQDRFFYEMAPLALGEMLATDTHDPIKDFAVMFDTVRQGDSIKMIVDAEGSISLELKGKDMGCRERVSLTIPPDLPLDHPFKNAYYALNGFLKLEEQNPA